MSGLNCTPESVYAEMRSTRRLYGKEGGRYYYHMVQSFSPDEALTAETAHAIALRLAEEYRDYEVLVCTHTDRKHLHSHFIINAVSFETGKKLHQSAERINELRQVSDELCLKFGLTVCQAADKPKWKGLSNREYRAAAKGESWKFALMAAIDACMRRSRTRAEFLAEMEERGYGVKWTAERQAITYTTPGGRKCRDFRLHEEKYRKERMELEFRYRAELIAGGVEAAQPVGLEGGRAGGAGERDPEPELGGAPAAAGRSLGNPDGSAGPAGGLGDAGGGGAGAAAAGGTAPGGGDGAGDLCETGWETERGLCFGTTGGTGAEPGFSLGAAADGAAPDGPAVGAGGGYDGLLWDAVRLGRAVEGLTDAVPPLAPATFTDGKLRRREQEKKRLLGQKPQREEERMEQTM